MNKRFAQLKKTGADAIAGIRPGQRVFIGSGCGEPQHLVDTLLDQAGGFADLEIVRLLSLESSLVAMMAEESQDRTFNVRSIYLGSGQTLSLKANQRFITPIPLSAVPRIFRDGHLPLDFALIQVTPPDAYGWMNLGISVDVTLAAAQSAACVIAQVNPSMPKIPGQGFIHIDQVDAIVEHKEDLLSAYALSEYKNAEPLARMAAGLVEDGVTLHLGLGTGAHNVARFAQTQVIQRRFERRQSHRSDGDQQRHDQQNLQQRDSAVGTTAHAASRSVERRDGLSRKHPFVLTRPGSRHN